MANGKVQEVNLRLVNDKAILTAGCLTAIATPAVPKNSDRANLLTLHGWSGILNQHAQ